VRRASFPPSRAEQSSAPQSGAGAHGRGRAREVLSPLASLHHT